MSRTYRYIPMYGYGPFGQAGGSGSASNLAIFTAPLITGAGLTRGSYTPSFTRATVARVTDFEGLVKQVKSGELRFSGARRVSNLLTDSEDFSNPAWASSGADAPSFTNDGAGVGIVTWASGGLGNAYQVYAPGVAGETYVYSVDIKLVTGSPTNFQIRIETTGAAGSATITSSLTADWQRFSIQHTIPAGATIATPTLRNATSVGSEVTVHIRHPQLERVNGQANKNPSEYVSTGVESSPYHGAFVDGVQYFDYENGNTVSSNVVTEAQGSAISSTTLLGALVEGQRTNRVLYSQDTSNGAWVASNITKGSTSVVTPSGLDSTTVRLTASAANGTLLQSITSAVSTRAYSVYMKRVTGTGNIDLTVDGGTTWTTKTLTSSWQRFFITQAAVTNPQVGVRIVTSGDAIDFWGSQLENFTYPTAYIQTTSSSATRNADFLRYTNPITVATGYLNVGSLICSVTYKFAEQNLGAHYPILSIANTAQSLLYIANTTGDTSSYDGTNTASANLGFTEGDTFNLGLSWNGNTGTNGLNLYSNGALSSTTDYDGSFNGTIQSVIALGVIASTGATGTSLNFKNLSIYGKELSQAALESLTA